MSRSSKVIIRSHLNIIIRLWDSDRNLIHLADIVSNVDMAHGVGWKYLCLQSRLPDRDGEFDDVDSVAVVTFMLDEP